MSIHTILTTAAGHGIDLLNPTPQQYRPISWLAEHLAKENRYNGATPGVTYPVAQHVSIGSDAVLYATGDRTLAAHFLFHDNPEAALKDDTTPKKNTIAELIRERCGVTAESILDCFRELEDRHDSAVHAAYGLPWPLTAEQKRLVKHFDLRMFVTEWRDLMPGIEHPNWELYRGIEALPARIVPVHWTEARDMYLERARALLPGVGLA